MSIKVRIPTPLQKLTENQIEVECNGSDIRELIANLDKKYPGMKTRLCDENGNLRRFINFFVNDKDIRFLQGDETKLKDGDEVSIVPAIAGGGSTLFFICSPLSCESSHPERENEVNESKEEVCLI